MTASRKYLYQVVDVFTCQALEGNSLAVFPKGEGLDEDTMQAIARELNLSETVFVFPPTHPDCVAQLRIFTPTRELPFAGHPTIGTSFVLLENGTVPNQSERFMLEEKVGPVPIRVEQGQNPLIWLLTPPIQNGPTFNRDLCAAALGLTATDLLDTVPQLLSAGNPTIFIGLRDKTAVDRAWLDWSGMTTLRGAYSDPVCVFVFTPTSEGAYSRMFAPEYGIAEDPATGSSTGPLAAYMMQHQLVSSEDGTRFVSEQGTKMKRRSLLHVQILGEGIEVGGHVISLVQAAMRI